MSEWAINFINTLNSISMHEYMYFKVKKSSCNYVDIKINLLNTK